MSMENPLREVSLRHEHVSFILFHHQDAYSVRISLGVDETKIVGEHASYHQAITGEEAKRRLGQCGGHCYLTRYSRNQDCYILSVYECQKPLDPTMEHFEITIHNNGRLGIRGKNKAFNNIRSLLEHYEQNRIDPALRSIGEAYTEKEYKRVQRQDEERQRQQEDERLRKQEAEREREAAAKKGKCVIV